MNTCDTCKWWDIKDTDPITGSCSNEKMVCEHKKATWMPDSFFAGETESFPNSPCTGPKFGCVHWEEKQ